MRELFGEIITSLQRNKLRTFLTGFSVAWGIFMLIILLGSGNGLKNGVMSNFEGTGMTQSTVSLYANRTSESYGGYQQGRRIKFDNEVMEILGTDFDQVEQVSPELSKSGSIRYGNVFNSTEITGIMPFYTKLEGIKILKGRNINETDIKERRNVVMLDEVGAQSIFGKRTAVGKSIVVDNISYDVIGVCKRPYGGNRPITYIPLSTYMKLYATTKDFNFLTMKVNNIKTIDQSKAFEDTIRKSVAKKLDFSPTDRGAMYVWSNIESFLEFQLIFRGINIFIWIIGLGTLLAGVVGVSNIMLVTVRERTAEFGIRKSMGAKPSSLVRLVILESIIITAIFGYIGMILGVGVMEVVNLVMERQLALSQSEVVIFKNPTLELSVMVSATITLITAGIIAGYVPARRASRIKTIDAMRHNK